MSSPVRIPADIEREDTLVANLTARQVTILAVAGIVLYVGYLTARPFLPLAAIILIGLPLAAGAALLALGRRDGLSMDRFVLAALRHRVAPGRMVLAPEGVVEPAPSWLAHSAHYAVPQAAGAPAPVRLAVEDVTEAGVVDLGADGLAAIAACTTINFALRTPAEQDSVVAAFGRYLHSLTAPTQILISTTHLDLGGHVDELHAATRDLPHPALRQACRDHADFLTDLAARGDLLYRQVLLILREPTRPAGPHSQVGGHPNGDGAS